MAEGRRNEMSNEWMDGLVLGPSGPSEEGTGNYTSKQGAVPLKL